MKTNTEIIFFIETLIRKNKELLPMTNKYDEIYNAKISNIVENSIDVLECVKQYALSENEPSTETK
jgi:hypothetical protein